jgi:hypothetical protein
VNHIRFPSASLFVALALLLPVVAFPTASAQFSANIDVSVPATTVLDTSPMRINVDWGRMPVYFIENQGQVDERVAYYVQGSDKVLYFAAGGVTFVLTEQSPDSIGPERGGRPGAQASRDPMASIRDRESRLSGREPSAPVAHWVVKLDFIGANPDVRPVGEERQETVISYFRGQPDQWHTGLPTYNRLVYRDLWPGIDLVYYGTVDRLKYESIVQPAADPAHIRLAYHGATDVSLNATGQLEVTTRLGGFTDDTPVAYQEIDRQRTSVSVAFGNPIKEE